MRSALAFVGHIHRCCDCSTGGLENFVNDLDIAVGNGAAGLITQDDEHGEKAKITPLGSTHSEAHCKISNAQQATIFPDRKQLQ